MNTPDMIEGLKASFKHIKGFGKKVTSSNVDVLQWHFTVMGKLEKELKEDAVLLRYANCKYKYLHCRCGKQSVLRWLGVCALVVNVQPSTVAAERVLSIINNMWTDKQTSSLSDMIKASLFLLFNKRLE
jgi:hypothetical protein